MAVEAFATDLFRQRVLNGDSAMVALMTDHFGPDHGAGALSTLRLTYGDIVGAVVKSSLTEVVVKNGSESWKAEVELVSTYSRVTCDESIDVVGDGKQFKVTGFSSYIQAESGK